MASCECWGRRGPVKSSLEPSHTGDRMQVKLKPLSHPDLGEITIEDPIFPVGRDEVPFSTYTQELVANLSRRHARIFEEAGNIYVADVGSRNGTELNKKSVTQKPMRVHQGDLLSFAGRFEYEVAFQMPEEEQKQQNKTTHCLILTPKGNLPSVEPMTITGFPFLIGKSNTFFAKSVNQELELNEYLSRRHAHFFVNKDTLYIEDLGSTNGTFVNGNRLNEHALAINSGDEILFGQAEFTYVASWQLCTDDTGLIEQPLLGQVESKQKPLSEDEHPDSTIFVSSANSFLDIFCVDEDEAVSETNETPLGVELTREEVEKSKPTKKGPVARFFIFITELRGELREQNDKHPYKAWFVLGGGIVVAGIVAGLHFEQAPKQEIQTYLTKQDYLVSAKLANDYLVNHPGDEDVSQWLTASVIKQLMPLWLDNLASAKYLDAFEQIKAVQSLVSMNSESLESALLELLQWVTRLHMFISERGGVDAPIHLYQHEESLETLLNWWKGSEQINRTNMELLSQYSPEFSDINRLTFSYLRILQSESSVYLAAIEKLKQTMVEKLLVGQAIDLRSIFQDFRQQYPRVAGVDLLQNDLEEYLKLEQQLAEHTFVNGSSAEMESIVGQFDTAIFKSPPFEEQVELLYSSNLSRMAPESLQKVSHAWRTGDLMQAISLLEQLNSESEEGLFISQLNNKRKLLSEFQTLKAAEGTEAYPRLLNKLYPRLNTEEDVFLVQALEADHRQLSQYSLEKAEKSWVLAKQYWNDYIQNGGILGMQRLEDRISQQFRSKADLLSKANESVHHAQNLFIGLQLEPDIERNALFQKIVAETSLQRRSLRQLSMVLSSPLLDSKLELLVEHSAEKKGAPK